MTAEPNAPPSRLARLFRRPDSPAAGTGIDAATHHRAVAAFEERRTRAMLFGDDAVLFGEPAWDILLDLFLAEAAGDERTIDQLCDRIDISAGSARRWIDALVERQLLVRMLPGGDPLRAEVRLSAIGIRLVAASLRPMPDFPVAGA
jgi:hypothetical protein